MNHVDVRKIKPARSKHLVFGRNFTDHMLSIEWDKASGWGKPEIIPFGPFELPTSATSLHYGMSVHEGITIMENRDTGKL